jgi:hypothetical protein
MIKRIIRKIIIFWGILIIIPAIDSVYFFFKQSDLYHDLYGFKDGGSSAFTWLDSNADGQQNLNEPPLADVCVWYESFPERFYKDDTNYCDFESHPVTDSQGKWSVFLAGEVNCKELWIFAEAPDGYQATTPLAFHGCSASFGFAPENAHIEKAIPSASDLIQRYSILLKIKNVIIVLLIIATSILGTIWLEKKPKPKS